MNIDKSYDKSVHFGAEQKKAGYDPHNLKLVTSNHSGYRYEGSENFEHDDTGCIHNYSGVEDEILSSYAEHGDWQEGYDY